jgi:hypothetical protein
VKICVPSDAMRIYHSLNINSPAPICSQATAIKTRVYCCITAEKKGEQINIIEKHRMLKHKMALSLNKTKLDNLATDIWKSAERLRGKFKAYEYQSVILPIIVIRRLECVLLAWREAKRAEVLARRHNLTEKELAKLVEKEPKSFGNKRNRITDAHRQWIEQRYREGWANGFADEQVKLFRPTDFAYHKVKVVFWQTDEHDQPAIITEPYGKTLSAASLAKEQKFYENDLIFRVRMKTDDKEKTVEFVLKPEESAAKKLKEILGDRPEILSVEWTHRHYVQDDEYIPHGEDIKGFLKREIAKPIIRWEDSPQLGCEILPNKYFYRYQQPTPAKELLEEFWRLEKEAEKMLEGLAK